MTPWINYGELYYPEIDIQKIAKHYNAKYVGEFCIKQRGQWTDWPVAVFYQETPARKEYSHYFGIYAQFSSIMITDASSTAGIPIAGMMAEDGEIIFSRYRHDYRTSQDRTATIDGGRDYMKSSGGKYVMLGIVEGELIIIENEDAFMVQSKLSETGQAEK